jgi:predicted nucleic acid-binding protein
MPSVADVLCDASVVLKWFHSEGEEEVEASRALLELHRTHGMALSVLDLTAYEVGNALLRGLGAGAEKVSAVLDALDVICPRLALTPTELCDAAILAEGHHLTMYDAAYAAAAKSRHAELATLDRALLQAGLGRRPSEILKEETRRTRY